MAEKNLEDKIKNLIRQDGPISIANFMQMVLFDKEFGYYNKQKPFGAEGDFITAPEISQVFGEVIGAYIAFQWQEMGEPEEFQIVELGPGNGSLMFDILRAIRVVPKLFANLKVHMVELSPALKEEQLKKLEKFPIEITHHEDFTKLPKIQSFFIANEFFDALPINQYQFRDKKWHERRIKLGEEDRFIFALEESEGAISFINEVKKPKDDDIYEICFPAINIMTELSNFISKTNSSGMFIDYGYIEKDYGDSLQALKKHKFNHIFSNLGEADLTAHVDFGELAMIAGKNDNIEVNIATQRQFFTTLGFIDRTTMLKTKHDQETAEMLDRVQERILGEKEMGDLFKVLLVEVASNKA